MKILHISDPLGRHAELTNLPEDEDRTNFLIEVPCREEFNKKNGPTNGPLNGPTSGPTSGPLNGYQDSEMKGRNILTEKGKAYIKRC